MKTIIKDIEKLSEVAKPLEFITDTGTDTSEGEGIIKELKAVMEADSSIIALGAPQIGILSRIFCIRFNDTIKTFINPIVTKKSNFSIKPETCLSMPGKEILINRPDEITVVYYTDEFKYEDNKLLGAAARLFDQQYQFLDGVTPADLGLVSDVAEDGSLADLTDEEVDQIKGIYTQFIEAKTKALEKELSADADLSKQYRQLKYTEGVITGKIAVVENEEETKRQVKLQSAANSAVLKSVKNLADGQKAMNKAKLQAFLQKKGK